MWYRPDPLEVKLDRATHDHYVFMQGYYAGEAGREGVDNLVVPWHRAMPLLDGSRQGQSVPPTVQVVGARVEATKVNRHGKPAKAFTSRLRGATSDDYERMVSACVEAVVRGSEDVFGLFPYTMKFPKDFPKGIREVEYEDGSNVYRMKAKKLLKWLNDKGHTDITMESLRGAIISSGLSMAAFDEMCDFPMTENNKEEG